MLADRVEPPHTYFEELERELEELEVALEESVGNYEKVLMNHSALEEHRIVLKKTMQFFEEQHGLGELGYANKAFFSQLTGVINKADV